MLCAVAALLLAGCAPQALLVRGVADQLATQNATAEDDLGLAREASAFYLKLSESVLRETPGHLPLAAAVAGGLTQYSYAFVAFEADRLEATNSRAALQQRQRAARLYARAHRHAMTALMGQAPGLRAALAAPQDPGWKLSAQQVAVAYWAAASWGGWISLAKDDPDTVADLPQAMRLATWAYAAEPEHAQGALATLMGQFELARPGGTPHRARPYFERGFTASGGRSAGALVAQAEALALPAGDRPAFDALLKQALAVAAAHRDLANEVARERALWLLDTIDERF